MSATKMAGNASSNVVGALADAAAQDGDATTSTVQSLVKGVLDVLYDTDGIVTWPSAAAPANGVSIAEAVRYICETIVGAQADAAVQAAGTASAQAYLKGILDVLSGSTGLSTFPTAAAAANGVSLAEVLRYVSENQLPRLVSKANANMATGFGTADSPVAQFTVTGDVKVRAIGVVTTNMTSASNTGTISLGTADSAVALIPAATADGTSLQAGDVWFDATSGTNAGAWPDDGSWVVLGNGADIVMTIGTNNITAGGVTVYVEWVPLSSGASVVAA